MSGTIVSAASSREMREMRAGALPPSFLQSQVPALGKALFTFRSFHPWSSLPGNALPDTLEVHLLSDGES